jgi:hypothetical protein
VRPSLPLGLMLGKSDAVTVTVNDELLDLVAVGIVSGASVV